MTLLLSSALVGLAAAAPTHEERCQAAKLQALRQRAFCIAGERRKAVLGKAPDLSRCDARFARAVATADATAARKGASCRWLENGDGTATDLDSGLQWELKTDDGAAHDKDHMFAWSDPAVAPTRASGNLFWTFLGGANTSLSSDGATSTVCFAGACDWRLPKVEELRSLLDAGPGACTGDPCTSIPGETASGAYWTRTNLDGVPTDAWFVDFSDGSVGTAVKSSSLHARLVRG
jgi:hypothetical protein